MANSQREIEPADVACVGRFASRVLLIGWEGAELPTLQPLLNSGRLANLSALLDQGARAEFSVPRPVFSEAAWTSLATGKRPHEHGILHANRPSADRSALQPITRLARRCPAMWNMFNRAGLRTHVVGWPATHPAERLDGVCVSDRFALPVAKHSLVPPDGRSISPAAAEPVLRGQRVAPAQIEEMTLSQLLPREATSLPEYPTLAAIARGLLAEAATLFRALRWCLNQQPWDFAACVFPGIRGCHELANWLQGLSPAAAEFREHLIAGCYEHHDLLLGQLLHQVGEETHVIAVSLAGHGAAVTGASDEANDLPRTGLKNRNVGLAVIRGPGIRHLAVSSLRRVLDLTPTICALLAVPYGKDLGGRPWLDLLEVELKPTVVDTWETNTADELDEPLEPATPGDYSANEVDRNRGVEHLIELGYVDPHNLAAREAVEQCRRITELNRAISMMDAGLLMPAITCLEQLAQEHADWFNAHAVLAEAYYRDNQWRSAQSEIDWLMCRGIEQPQLYFLSAAIEFANRRYDLALEELRCAGRAGVVLPGSRALEGEIQLRKRNFEAARAAFQSSIALEGPSRQSLDGLAAVSLYLNRYEEAAANALDALALEMRFGRAHYHLAVALLELDKPHEALRALETWAAVEPQAAAPFRWMARVCERQLDDLHRAAEYREQGRKVVRRRRETIKSSPAVGTSTPSSAL